MAIAEDVRNLFKEFGGRAESYLEFDHYFGQPSASTESAARVRVAGSDVTKTHDDLSAAGEPRVEQPLGSVFARLAGRAPDK